MKKLVTLVVFVSNSIAQAEFGISGGAVFNFKANFHSTSEAQGFDNDPGAPVAATDHFYDDGYNRIDSSGNVGNLTSYWGYENASQDHGGSLIMSSSQTHLDAQSHSGRQTEGQPAIEIYWQKMFTTNQWLHIGIRSALRRQRIKIDSTAQYSTTTETISDTYSYVGILPGAPFAGSYSGPNFLLDDTPDRAISYSAGTSFIATREFHANLYCIDLGPTISMDICQRLRLNASIGGSIARIDSKFRYHDAGFSDNKEDESSYLWGAFASTDLCYLTKERWGIFGGVSYTYLSNFDQTLDGRSVELQFDNNYTLRVGVFFR